MYLCTSMNHQMGRACLIWAISVIWWLLVSAPSVRHADRERCHLEHTQLRLVLYLHFYHHLFLWNLESTFSLGHYFSLQVRWWSYGRLSMIPYTHIEYAYSRILTRIIEGESDDVIHFLALTTTSSTSIISYFFFLTLSSSTAPMTAFCALHLCNLPPLFPCFLVNKIR